MEASCFGFEEDDPIESNDGGTSHPVRYVKRTFRFGYINTPKVARTVSVSSPMPENPVSITQVQELLLQDMSPTRDSSFYEELQNEESENKEKDTPVRVRQTRKKRLLEEMEDESMNNENVENLKRTPARIIARPVQTKRPLGEIQNFDDSLTPAVEKVTKKGNEKNAEKIPIRVFTRPVRKKKPAAIENSDINETKSIMKKKGKKEVENERKEQLMNEFADQMNSKFKAVEDYQLVIE